MSKIKKFCKDYIAKVLRKLEKSGQRQKPSSAASTLGASTSSAPSPHVDSDSPGHDHHAPLDTPNDAMDIDRVDDTPQRSSHIPNETSSDTLNNSWPEAHTQADSSPTPHQIDGMDADGSAPQSDQAHDEWTRARQRQGDDVDAPVQTGYQTSSWGDSNGDPRVRYRKEESGWDPDRGGGSQRSLLERIQPLSS